MAFDPLMETPVAPLAVVVHVLLASGGLSTGVSKAVLGSMSMSSERYQEATERLESVSRWFEPRQTAADYLSSQVGNLMPSYLENETKALEMSRDIARLAKELREGKIKADDVAKVVAEGVERTGELVARAAREVELQRKETKASEEREREAREQEERRQQEMKQASERRQVEIERINREIGQALEKPSSNRYDYRDNQVGNENNHAVVA